MVRTRTSKTNLHSFWDGLPGRGQTAGEIGKLVQEMWALYACLPHKRPRRLRNISGVRRFRCAAR